MGKVTAHFSCKCGRLYDFMVDQYRLVYPDCPDCGEVMDYDRTPADNPDINVTGHYGEPIIMYSVGLCPGEEKAFFKANREIELTPDGVPIAKTRQEKKQILKYFDYEERN